MKLRILLPVLFLWTAMFGQGSPDYGGGLKVNLDADGRKYLRVLAWNQIWVRQTSFNPGSMIGDEAASTHSDIANRRLRILVQAQISPRYVIVTHFGINNQTFASGGTAGSSGTGVFGAGKKPSLFFHDAWNEYAVIMPREGGKFSLSMGAGLHYYMGLSRLSMASTLNMLLVDEPIFNWPLIDLSDQFGRQIGIFAKGKYGRLEYRLSINKPFATNLVPVDAPNAGGSVAVDNSGRTRWSKAGYFEYQFKDRESNLLPYKVGSYLGTKKVFNLGAGFYVAPQATRSMTAGVLSKHDIRLFSADLFADFPIGKPERKMAITAYGVLYNFDFGPNYLRNIGIMNPAVADPEFTGAPALAGVGNAQPVIGTGNILYAQTGLLLPTAKEKPKVRVQPFGAVAYKNFEALDKASLQYDVGSNFFLDGHHAKLTAQYSARPVYTSVDEIKRLYGEFILQLQIYL